MRKQVELVAPLPRAEVSTGEQKVPTLQAPPGEAVDFIGNDEMLNRVPVSAGTLAKWRRAGQ